MSEKPAFVRCPYCQHKLDKIPTRKTKCPDCGKPIFVRAGDLLREDELEKPAGATAARPRRPKSSGGDTAVKPKKKRKPSAQADRKEPRKPRKKRKKLTSDMRRKKRETYSRRDLDGGIQLLLGIMGKLLAGGNFMDVVGGLLGGMVGGDTGSAGDRLAASGSAPTRSPRRRTTSTTRWARTSNANCAPSSPGPRTGSTLEIG